MLLYNHIFQEEETGTGDGVELDLTYDNVYPETQMVIDIQTDASGLTVNFEAQGENENWIAFTCYNYSDGSTGTSSALASNQIWQAELTGLKRFRVRISIQSGATNGTTIIGRVISER